ncbi:ABC transporter substrate-binding protein [uncultured Corynebacterium sp.]|uniref:ABC transporter substrate-binding protein n=1 Tax=uncultured Corynebacterium sp. TaxID=159447 RepID=UPI0025D0BFDB|nr:ABC transporter substrate-binding protein [uncultured Corynebacterium sp.]
MNQLNVHRPVGINRRSFLALLGITGAGAALTACAGTGGGDANGGENGSGGGAEGDPNTIVWWSNHPASSKDIEEELISRFEAENPDLTVRLVDGGKNYEELGQKFNAALSGTDLPDVIVLSDVWWFNFALNGQIANVDEVTDRAGVDTSTYVDSLYEDYAHDGGHYAMPFARSTPLFYYNKDLWAEAGLPDRGPETWEEMTEWGATLQEKLSGRERAHGWGNAVDYLSWTFEGPLWTLGGSYSEDWDLKLTSPETIEAVEWLKSTVDDGWATVSNDLANEFGTGLLGSIVASTGDLAGILETADFEVGTAFLPNPDGDGGCPTGGAGLAIPSGISEQRQDNAAKFIDFITNTENTAYWSRSVGYMPVRKDAVEDPEQQAFMEENPNFRTAVEQLPETRPQDNARVFLPNGDRKIGDALETILLSGAAVESTLQSLEGELQGIYERDIEPKL